LKNTGSVNPKKLLPAGAGASTGGDRQVLLGLEASLGRLAHADHPVQLLSQTEGDEL